MNSEQVQFGCEKESILKWYKENFSTKENGFTVIYRYKTIFWLLNGQFHCDDGPAIQRKDGNDEWWLYGKKVTEDEFKYFLEKKELNAIKNSSIRPIRK